MELEVLSAKPIVPVNALPGAPVNAAAVITGPDTATLIV
jgi:hypothetical protein